MKKLGLYGLVVIAMLGFATSALTGEVGLEVIFTDGEASIIRAYYRDQRIARNGKNKHKKGMPPGIARNLKRGKPLPPGIAKQALPAGLIDLLPSPPDGFERIEMSGKVLLVEVATQVIHDVLEDVILGK